MFCDADDMFVNMCGMYIIFREMAGDGFNVMTSVFVEETKNFTTDEKIYINREMDSTFVHGKVYRRSFLINNKIRWNDALTVHEDSYFNCLAQKMTASVKYCQQPFYLWKWRDGSVCRHDPKYILKTYNNMLDSNTALVNELQRRGILCLYDDLRCVSHDEQERMAGSGKSGLSLQYREEISEILSRF